MAWRDVCCYVLCFYLCALRFLWLFWFAFFACFAESRCLLCFVFLAVACVFLIILLIFFDSFCFPPLSPPESLVVRNEPHPGQGDAPTDAQQAFVGALLSEADIHRLRRPPLPVGGKCANNFNLKSNLKLFFNLKFSSNLNFNRCCFNLNFYIKLKLFHQLEVLLFLLQVQSLLFKRYCLVDTCFR